MMSVIVDERQTMEPDDDTVIVVSDEEFHAAATRALTELGLTYTELAAQARQRDFVSARAHALWVSIGGTVDL